MSAACRDEKILSPGHNGENLHSVKSAGWVGGRDGGGRWKGGRRGVTFEISKEDKSNKLLLAYKGVLLSSPPAPFYFFFVVKMEIHLQARVTCQRAFQN